MESNKDYSLDGLVDAGIITPITSSNLNLYPPANVNNYGYNQDYFDYAMGKGPTYQTNWNVMQGMDGRATPREFGTNIWDLGKSLLGNAYYSKPVQTGLAEGKEFYKRNHAEVPDKQKFNNIWGAINTIGGIYSGVKQLRMANKQFKMQRDMWNKSWDATRKNTNEALEYRSSLRNNGDAAKVAEDMKKYGI